MDTRLSEIASKGDVRSLTILMEDNPLILDLSFLSDDSYPLHISAIAGQVEFVREILRRKPELAWELNQDGFTPLHIASAKGDIVIAKEILKLGDQLCVVKGKEGRIPLHYTAIKGRDQVMEELLSARPDSVEEVTARGETAVHLAVRHSRFKTFRVMAEHLKKSKKEAVLNRKDSQGNTALHIAAAREDYEVIQYMVSSFIGEALIEVNARNDAGLTALDMLFLPTKEAENMEIVTILMKYGAARATGSDTAPPPTRLNSPDGQELGSRGEPSENLKWIEYFKFKKERDSPGEVRSALLVVAALILTATYQAVLQPPGGLWPDDSGSHQAGKSVLGTKKPVSYILFLVLNSLGFFISIQTILMLTAGFPMERELRIALLALVMTYDTLMATFSPNNSINYVFVALTMVIPIVVAILSFLSVRRRM